LKTHTLNIAINDVNNYYDNNADTGLIANLVLNQESTKTLAASTNRFNMPLEMFDS